MRGRELSGIMVRLLVEQLVNSGVTDVGESLGEEIVLRIGVGIEGSV